MKPLAKFTDSAQHTHNLYGVSLFDFQEFWSTYNCFLQAIRLAESNYESFEELYKADIRFRQDTNKLLELNGVDLRWVTLQQITELLLYRATETGIAPGLLIEINTPRGIRQVAAERSTAFGNDEADFFWDSIVALSTYTNDANAALELSKKLNSRYIQDLVAAQARFSKAAQQVASKAPQVAMDKDKVNELLDNQWTSHS